MPTPLSADALTSKNASNIIIGSGGISDNCFDGYVKTILSILDDLQCAWNLIKSHSSISGLSAQTEKISGSLCQTRDST